MRWSGTCLYERQTRWATNLPHIITLTADSGRWSIRISGRRTPPSGTVRLSPAGEGDYMGLVMQGAGVMGGVVGTLESSRAGNNLFVDVMGVKAYRDTVPLRASCRMGPIEAAPADSAP